MTQESTAPVSTPSITTRFVRWLQGLAAPLLMTKLKQCEDELTLSREDIKRLHEELDAMSNTVEGKDKQILAAAEALASANADVARTRRTTNQLQTALDNERRFNKQQRSELAQARQKQKRR
ncbi:hypothetical protein LZ683_08600 [Comamonas testosteroni]|uniref:hypothetical protein n=1 Tax=Comamonas testosteroni TaxID=285 RepID=UPI0023AADA3D|nr:hypothetical protein [Comamonas testosteroni]WEE79400.1 hypothetical protein LZ683_08600 [Comamonas testosteroni]